MVSKSDFAYTPDDVPSHWKLDISDREHCIAAKAALGPHGYRGRRVQIPEDALPGVVRKLNAACKRFGLDPFTESSVSQSDIQNGNDDLEHFGIIGMKWGVRRDRKELNRLAGRKSKTVESKESRQKSINEMSDAELRTRLNRLQMEKQYHQLLEQKANGFSDAQESAGEKYAKAFANKAVDKAGTLALDLAFNYVVKPAVAKQIKNLRKK